MRHGSPNCAGSRHDPDSLHRRRALFTDPAAVTLDLDEYTRLRLQHGWSAGYAPREAVLRWYLRVLLTGEHLAPGGAKKPFAHQCTAFRYCAPGALRAFVRLQAEANLARHGITEPVTGNHPRTGSAGPPGNRRHGRLRHRHHPQAAADRRRAAAPSYRRPSPESGITREWQEREYTVERRLHRPQGRARRGSWLMWCNHLRACGVLAGRGVP